MDRKKASEFDPELLVLFDDYVHGGADRRQFLDRAARFAVGGVTAATLLESLSPHYAWAQQVAPDDARLKTEYVSYPSPKGHDTIKATSRSRRTPRASCRPCSSCTRTAASIPTSRT